jgi:ABC-2 type transport system ATP-binding protein
VGIGLPSIAVRSFTKRFGGVVAVDDLTFEVGAGRVTGFLGPNGAGKTTTLRALLGLVRPTSGRALVNGVPYAELSEPAGVVGAVLESTGFHPGRTARHHLRIVATEAGIPPSRVEEVLEQVGLVPDADRRVGGYSMGMRQRLELARAMLGKPEILILDEPANGLDPQGIAWLRGFLRWYASEDRIVLVSSHLLAEAAQTVEDVVILVSGRLAAQGRLEDLLKGVSTSVRVRTAESRRLVEALSSAGISSRFEPPDYVVATASGPEAVGRVIAGHQIVVHEMTSSGESLEDLFFSLTDNAAHPVGLPVGPPPGGAR